MPTAVSVRPAETRPAPRPAPRPVPDVLAAVDLGSNSFHMVVARYSHGQLVIIDRLREMVRLAAGVAENGRIDKDVSARALACLQRFGQRLRDMHADSVRVVGTNALRLAHKKQAFLERAREALGHPIEIIAGMEEARLIYSGVAHTMPTEPGKRLVVDIGGGSTELIIGEGLNPLELESLQMGCVSLSERFFRDGKISAKRFERARLAARLELEPVQAAFRRRGWDNSAGSSGTVRAIGEVIRALEPSAVAITAAGITRAIEYCVDAGHTRELSLEPITEDRRPVFPGGLAILAEVFSVLDIRDMRIAEGAMREGLLYDMLGRYKHEDARERTVRAMQQRYHVDVSQAERVEATVRNFLEQARGTWKLEEPLAHLALKWAARLHEIGLDVSHSGYPPRRLSARERRHAGISARGAAAARAIGRRSPPQARARRPRGAGAPLGPQRALPDRAAAARGAAAPRAQRHGAAADRSGGHREVTRGALSGPLARGASAHLGRPAAGGGLPARQRLSHAGVQPLRAVPGRAAHTVAAGPAAYTASSSDWAFSARSLPRLMRW